MPTLRPGDRLGNADSGVCKEDRTDASTPKCSPARRCHPNKLPQLLKLFLASLRPRQAVGPVIRSETGSRRADAGGLGGDPARQEPALGNRRDVGLGPARLRPVTDERGETLIEAHENAFWLSAAGGARRLMRICAQSCWNRRATVAVGTASIPAFSTSPATAVSPAAVRAASAQTKGKAERAHPLPLPAARRCSEIAYRQWNPVRFERSRR